MEAILILILVFFGGAIIRGVLNAGVATARTATGKGSLGGNFRAQFQGMGPLEFRIKRVQATAERDFESVEVEARGLFPALAPDGLEVTFVVSVFDVTDGEDEFMLSSVDTFQEKETAVFQSSSPGLAIREGYGLMDWASVGIIIYPILQPPRAGDRRLKAVVRLLWDPVVHFVAMGVVHTDDFVDLCMSKPNPEMSKREVERLCVIASEELLFWHTFTEKGYKEEADDEQEARGLAIKLAMAVAMADGDLADEEGEVMKKWIIRQISAYNDEKKQDLKRVYNSAMRSAYADAEAGRLSLSPITGRLNEMDSDRLKYESIELCHEVMAADGVVEAEEMQTIRKLTKALGLDLDEIEKMRDRHLVKIDVSDSGHTSVEDQLGIDPDWDNERIRRHLRKEFKKWSDRLSVLSEGEERDNAQAMMERLSAARQKYTDV
jgi:tellurite resistance protein